MISFLIPFASEDPYREASAEYVYGRLLDSWSGQQVLIGANGGDFNRSASRNLLAKSASAGILAFNDADSYCPARQVLAACALIEGGKAEWCFPYNRYYSLTEASTEKVLQGDPVTEDLDYEYLFPSDEHPEPSVGGCVVVSRKAFETVRGYDERFIGWGEEDRAFEMALDTLVHPGVRLDGPIFHLWHPWKEADCFEQPHFVDNRILCNRYRDATHDAGEMSRLVLEKPVTGIALG